MVDEPKLFSLPMTAAYFRLILRRFGATKRDRAALLRGTGVAREPQGDGEITVRSQLRQLANLSSVAGEGFGLELGAALDGAAHGPSGTAIVTAPTLGAALETLVRSASLRTPFIELRAVADGERHRIEVVERCALGAVRRPLLEMVLLSTQAVVESVLGRTLREARFVLPGPPPPYARRYGSYFHAPVTCGGGVAAVSLPSAWLGLPCALADPALHRGACTRLEADRQRLAGGFVDARIEAMFDTETRAIPSLVDVARRLRVSPRTLVRKLQARGTSYRKLVVSHRRRHATELLARRDLSIAEIADRLGYDEPGNFGRACRRWFGRSPRALRAARATQAEGSWARSTS